MSDAYREGDGFLVAASEVRLALPAVLDVVRELGLDLVRLSTRHASLEDVFVSLTGRHLREG